MRFVWVLTAALCLGPLSGLRAQTEELGFSQQLELALPDFDRLLQAEAARLPTLGEIPTQRLAQLLAESRQNALRRQWVLGVRRAGELVPGAGHLLVDDPLGALLFGGAGLAVLGAGTVLSWQQLPANLRLLDPIASPYSQWESEMLRNNTLAYLPTVAGLVSTALIWRLLALWAGWDAGQLALGLAPHLSLNAPDSPGGLPTPQSP